MPSTERKVSSQRAKSARTRSRCKTTFAQDMQRGPKLQSSAAISDRADVMGRMVAASSSAAVAGELGAFSDAGRSATTIPNVKDALSMTLHDDVGLRQNSRPSVCGSRGAW